MPSPYEHLSLPSLRALLQHNKELFADDRYILQRSEQELLKLYRELKALQYEIAMREAQATSNPQDV